MYVQKGHIGKVSYNPREKYFVGPRFFCTIQKVLQNSVRLKNTNCVMSSFSLIREYFYTTLYKNTVLCKVLCSQIRVGLRYLNNIFYMQSIAVFFSWLVGAEYHLLLIMRHYIFYITSKVPMFPNVAATKSSIVLMIKYPIDIEIYLTVYVEAYHILSARHF